MELSFIVTRVNFIVCLTLLLISCGGGGGSSSSAPVSDAEPPQQSAGPSTGSTTTNPDPSSSGGTTTNPDPPTAPPEPEITRAEAAVFLSQASFGATDESVQALQAADFETWIDQQFALPTSGHLEYMLALPDFANNAEARIARIDAFFNHAVNGEDQLRQRVVYALSQIMVVSENSGLSNQAEGLAHYYDLLGIHAFGNFRELMEAVTLSPSMGVYLSMLGNEKPNTALNIRPDENYARELMQLFTIGLVELNLDGSVVLSGGQPVPTYNQEIIEGFAHVFTGWTFAGSPRFENPRANFLAPMVPFEEFHDTGEKQLLNGVLLPANQTAQQDLEAAMDNIFAHTNVAPFISKQLIQRLVTANPTPAYVARVASVFNDNGLGVKGDMRSVIKAILLDSEARGDNNGKLIEPLIRLVALWRAYDASAANGRYIFPNPEDFFAQAPLRSPSVFNFYSPSFAPSGEIADANLVSPEMEITNETTVASTNDVLAFSVFSSNTNNPDRENAAISIDFSEHFASSGDGVALLDEVSLKLLGTPAPESLVAATLPLINQIPANNETARVAEAIHAVVTSLEFATLGN